MEILPKAARVLDSEGLDLSDLNLAIHPEDEFQDDSSLDPLKKHHAHRRKEEVYAMTPDDFSQLAKPEYPYRYSRFTGENDNDARVIELRNRLLTTEGLTTRQKQIIESWFESGLRGNTYFMIDKLDLVLSASIPSEQKPDVLSDRFVLTTFFTDIFNRADEIFDAARSYFINEDKKLDIGSAMNLPIITLNEDSSATVAECVSLLFALIQKSKEYQNEEKDALIGWFNNFYQKTVRTMAKYEGRGEYHNYSFEDAKSLRKGTLYPLSEFMSDLFFTSKLKLSAKKSEVSEGIEIADTVGIIALLFQFNDDLVDSRRDLRDGNVNLFLGCMNDCSENMSDDYGGQSLTWEDAFEEFPLTTEMYVKKLTELIESLPRKYSSLISFLKQYMKKENFTEYEEDP